MNIKSKINDIKIFVKYDGMILLQDKNKRVNVKFNNTKVLL